MNYRNVIKVLGGLLLLLSFCQGGCLLYAWLDHERQPGLDAVEALIISSLISGFAGILCLLTGRKETKELLRKEAITVVGMGWLVCAFFGAIPYMLAEPSLGLIDSLFESMSGFTTTGATVITDLEIIPRGILLWRAMTQWLGGMGILVLFVALLSSFRIGSRAIFRHESSALQTEGIASHSRDLALRLWLIYLGLTAACILGLKALGMGFFDAVCHGFTTVSTGGFGNYNTSIAYFQNSWIELWMILFMVLGGLNFVLYAWLLRRGWKRWKEDEESKTFAFVLTLATVVIATDLMLVGYEDSWIHALRIAAFQVVSIMTTSGFVTADFDTWPPLANEILLMLMVIGGCAGSTAGGVKLSRWLLFFKSIKLHLSAAFRPNRIMSISLNGRPVSDALRTDTLFFIGLAGVTTAFGSLLVALMEPTLDLESSVSAVMAALFNIGPGLGAVGPTQNFAGLAGSTKLILSTLMALGRLEFYAILVLFLPSLWRRY